MNSAEADWKARAQAIKLELQADYVKGADVILNAAYEAIVQAVEQSNVLVRVTITRRDQLRVIVDCFTILRRMDLIDLSKTKMQSDPGAPTLEFKNGSAIEFVTVYSTIRMGQGLKAG
jgi:hypothetical protein